MRPAADASAADVRPSAADARAVSLIAVICVLLLGASVAAWRFIPPALAPRINIRWAPSVTDVSRADAERRFRLWRGEAKDGRTWAYDLGDVSHGNVAALVADRRVEDTHYINRTAATIWRTAPPGTTVIGGIANRARDSAALEWIVTTSATTLVVAALWLVGAGRRRIS